MARIRTIKPEFFTSEDVSALPMRARLTWIGLWTHCDDHGRTKDTVKLIKAAVWPLDQVTLQHIEEDLQLLSAAGRIVRYAVDGNTYLAVVNWHRHQNINRMSRPKHPGPPTATAPSDPDEVGYCEVCSKPNPHGVLSEPSLNGQHPVDNPKAAGQTPENSRNDLLTESSLSPHGALTPGKERNREGKGRDARAHARDQPAAPTELGPEPPQKCDQHLHDPDPPSCGRCKDARKAWETWQRERLDRDARTRSQAAHQHAQAARWAIDNCPLCDNTGKIRGRTCLHDTGIADRTARGAAAARAQLGRTK